MPDIILIIVAILGAAGYIYSRGYSNGYQAALNSWHIEQTVYKPLRERDKI